MSVAGSKLEISRRSLEDFSGTVRIEKPDGSASEIELERQASRTIRSFRLIPARRVCILSATGGKNRGVRWLMPNSRLSFAGTASTGEMLLPGGFRNGRGNPLG